MEAMDRKQKEALILAFAEKGGVNALVNRSAVNRHLSTPR